MAALTVHRPLQNFPLRNVTASNNRTRLQDSAVQVRIIAGFESFAWYRAVQAVILAPGGLFRTIRVASPFRSFWLLASHTAAYLFIALPWEKAIFPQRLSSPRRITAATNVD